MEQFNPNTYKKQNSITTTSEFSGAFNQAKTRQEFMNLLHNQ